MFKLSGRIVTAVVAAAASITSGATFPPAVHQRHFSSPDLAIAALIAADRANDRSALLQILGVEGAALIHSGDRVADQRGRARFAAAFEQQHKIQFEGQDMAVLVVGMENWPLPIPLIHDTAGWRFDTEQGKQEILDRRIGRDELKVIEVSREYVEAQREYAAMKIGGTEEFARQFNSTPGRHDGLYWPQTNPGDPPSPLGPLVAEATAMGYTVHPNSPTRRASHPFYGYYFRILTAQGPNAPEGAKSYIVDGRMTRGFGLIAYPATYGDSGIMTFIVNQTGIVFEKNLGPDTTRIAREITLYDPDPSWHAP